MGLPLGSGSGPPAGREGEAVCLELFNRNYYTPCRYEARWTLLADGDPVRTGSFDTGSLAPRSRTAVGIDVGPLPEGKECFLNVDYALTEDLPWADAGYAACREQLFLQAAASALVDPARLVGRPLRTSLTKEGRLVVRGRGFKAEFDPAEGTLYRLRYRGRDVFVPGQGPKLNAFRALTNNDGWACKGWFAQGLHQLQHRATGNLVVPAKDGGISILYEVVSQAPDGAMLEGSYASPACRIVADTTDAPVMAFTAKITWTVHPSGWIICESAISSDRPDLPLPRIGYRMQLPAACDRICYYGRGPEENYSDRYTCAFVGKYRSTVAEQMGNYTKPQECGNHESVRWVSLTGRGGRGVRFDVLQNNLRHSEAGAPVMSFSALPYAALDLVTAAHQFELPAPGDTWLCLDAAVTGLGGNSCGPAPLPEDRVYSDARFAFLIRPTR